MQVDLRRRGLQSFDPAEFASTDEHLQLLLQVRRLDLSHNSLYTIRGLEGLSHLMVLNISHNGLRTLGGGLPLTLRELDASHNSLGSLQNAALLPLESLVSLNISFNELEDLRGVPTATAQLVYLDVRSNRLTSLIGLEHCTQLRTLHAEANLLRDVADVASLRSLPVLQSIFLAGNPLLLRKRRLHALQLLLPSGLEQDDLPATAPPSSIRSSTAAPPSVPDTSSIGSLDHSTIMSTGGEARDEVCSSGGCVGGYGAALGSRSASAHSNRPLSLHDSATTAADEASRAARGERGAASTHRQSQSQRHSGLRQLQQQPHSTGSGREVLFSVTAQSTPATVNAVTTAASLGGSPPGVVGCEADSPSCPRRALPHEHRLTDSPASVSASSSSPDRRPQRHPQQRNHSQHPLPAASPLPAPTIGDGSSESRSTATSTLRHGAVPPALPSSRASRLTTEELEDRLARVTAERDDYRREAAALRQELRELRQLCARQWEQESRLAASTGPVQTREWASAATASQAYAVSEPPSRVLAVEMSAHTSSADSLDGDIRKPAASSTRTDGAQGDPSPPRDAPAAVAPAVSVPALHASTTNGSGGVVGSAAAAKMDRREMAALFMSALQKRGAAA